MKRFAICVLLASSAMLAAAQVKSNNDKVPSGEPSLVERVAKIEKQNDWFNLYMNMNGSFNADFNQGGVNGLSQGAFRINQLRIEAKGKVNDWLSYRWRQRLNRDNDGSNDIDNAPTSIDIAGIGVKLSDKWSLFAGKQCAAYGGFEFDLNPIEIYQYSEIINNMSNFMTGLTVTYDFNPNQQLQFQVLNSLNEGTEATYGKNLEHSRMPLVYTLNWNANMFGGFWQTRWSVSLMDEAKDKYMYYIALGNQFNFSKRCNMYIDLMSSTEELDRKGIMTNMLGGRDMFDDHNAFNAMYNSVVAKVNYRFKPKWNFFVKGMLESAAMFKSEDGVEKGNYRTSLGYVTGVEFYPMDTNLHFYLTFVGQSNFFTERAKMYGNDDYNTQRVSVGFIYQLPVF